MSRYIDADELINKINAYVINSQDVMYIRELIKETPTADVIPRARYKQLLENSTIMADALKEYENADVRENVRGEWVIKDDSLNDFIFCIWKECSVCGERISGLETTYNFCPACGADMRGERK